MLDVYFESDQEVIRFCETLFCYNKEIELSWKTHEEWGNHLHFEDRILNAETVGAMGKSMVDVFTRYRLTKMIKRVIKEDYYYTNTDEIERILDLTHGMINDRDDLKRKDINCESVNEQLVILFTTSIQNSKAVHYDSIVQFRLKNFRTLLSDYIGLAIDEFKQEEDHQAFIDMLRKYIGKKNAIYNEIYILQGKNFSFFKSTGKRFSTLELRTLMYNEPLYIVGLDVDELNLAPLVAISPKRIKIYGDNPSEPKTLTVINVFQERVVFEPYNHFPFPHIGST